MSDFFDVQAQKQAQLDADDRAAKQKATLLGRYITHPYADGNAVYKIVRLTAKHAFIEHVDIGDGWVLPAWGKKFPLPIAKASNFVKQRDHLNQFFTKLSDWWEQQEIGAIVHYDDGGGQFVRATIVLHDGTKQAMPIALVGHWRQHALVNRRPDGSLHYGYHAERIIKKEPFQPNASNMVEYPAHDLRADQVHPSTLPEIDLTPPALSVTHKAVKSLETAQEAVRAVLNVADQLNDDAAHNARVLQQAFDAAKKLLG